MKNLKLFARLSTAYKNRAEPEHLRSLAEDAWRLLTMLAVLFVVLACAFGFWKFSTVSQSIEEAQNQPAPVSEITLDQQQLDASVQALQSRTTTFNALSSGSASTSAADPFTN